MYGHLEGSSAHLVDGGNYCQQRSNLSFSGLKSHADVREGHRCPHFIPKGLTAESIIQHMTHENTPCTSSVGEAEPAHCLTLIQLMGLGFLVLELTLSSEKHHHQSALARTTICSCGVGGKAVKPWCQADLPPSLFMLTTHCISFAFPIPSRPAAVSFVQWHLYSSSAAGSRVCM